MLLVLNMTYWAVLSLKAMMGSWSDVQQYVGQLKANYFVLNGINPD